ncbi:hypothetical protein EFL95_17430 [Nocardioides marmorisolisilvae]|uniref:Right handed beta helix domain-containing protein n=2 Tax=Nocardioides marmorisolisilvae TaxID=1542737 RepID=A0A3N0DQ56_9ACTN|nr:hypothetical protein EFL95_17430 [Nocardioides marmorisolisilvae]
MGGIGMLVFPGAQQAGAAGDDGTVSVRVVREINANGIWDHTAPILEPGLPGAVVTVTDPQGHTQSGPTDDQGQLTLDPSTSSLTGGKYRVSVSNPDPAVFSPAFAAASPTAGQTSLSPSVDFVDVSGGKPASITTGFWNPSDYTQDNPRIISAHQRDAVYGVGAGSVYTDIYAFNRQHGTIANSYASGSADSGFYVGQCLHCDIVVTDNVAEYNAVGYESANSTGVSVVRNRFSRNRVGLTMSSDYQEAFAPQRKAIVAGNVVSDNNEAQTPEQADGGFGIGIGLGGSTGVEVLKNRIEGNRSAGLLVSPAEDLAAKDNTAKGNVYAGNGTDLAFWSSAQSGGTQANCLERPAGATTYPRPWRAVLGCESGRGPLNDAEDIAPFRTVPGPAGIAFLDVAPPGLLPTMPGDPASVPYRRAQAPDPIDIGSLTVPPRTWLAEAARRSAR